MSSGLMSCVRENSPPLELDATSASGPLSLPETHSSGVSSHMMGNTSTPVTSMMTASTSTDGAAPNAEQKRRRFHPLRNLRRIFRRRTITSVVDTPSNTSLQLTASTPAGNSNSEKNLRSATLSAISTVASASSPSSPLTHAQLQDAYSSQSLPKSKSYSNAAAHEHRAHRNGGDALLGKTNNKKLQQQRREKSPLADITTDDNGVTEMYATTTTTSKSSAAAYHAHSQRFAYMSGVEGLGGNSGSSQRQSLGVAVFPAAMNRSFFAERQKLRSVGDSSLDLDSSGNDSGSHTGRSNNNTNTASGCTTGGGTRTNGGGSGGEMSDSQRSLSEGRLVDSDYTRDQLSQSHDSVFSESATASSLSIVLKAELADVLRKRRNRPDASDEDLGLPRSPVSPQRRAEHTVPSHSNGTHQNNSASNIIGGGNQSEVSSLSLLSMNSTDGEEAAALSVNDAVQERTLNSTRYARSSTMSSISVNSDILRHSSSSVGFNDAKDEVDLFSSDWQRLSHAAAKHKMAIRPAKKKVPSRQHRRTLETSIPEANEESLKQGTANHLLDVVDHDTKSKTRSLPPSVNAKMLEQHVANTKKNTTTTTNTNTNTAKIVITGTSDITTTTTTAAAVSGDIAIKRSKHERAGPTVVVTTGANNSKISTSNTTISTTTSSGSSTTNLFGLRTLSSKAAAMFESKETAASTVNETEKPKKPEESLCASNMETTESGFLRRLMQRNSKRSIAKSREGEKDEPDMNQSEPKKLQISSSAYEVKSQPHTFNLPVLDKCRSEITYEQNIEETRKEIKREIMHEGKSGLSAMLNNFMSAEKSQAGAKDSALQKPKSGPAARQRYLPQEITASNTLEKKLLSTTKEPLSNTSLLSQNTPTHETFQSTSIIREITASQQLSATSMASSKSDHHFERKPKIVGLSAFQQKISRSNDSFARTSSTNTSSNSMETVGNDTLFTSYEQKQRRSVEKSRSFRTYNEETRDAPYNAVHSNMPSLPDLSLNLRVPCFGEFILNEKEYSSPSPPEPDAHDKSVSLGFEINDNNLVRPALRAESASHLLGSQSSYAKNVILTTSGNIKTSSTKLLTPSAAVMPSLSPTTSCNKNISEIEQNIDLIVKSPYVSVLRKSAHISDEMAIKIPTVALMNLNNNEKPPEPEVKPIPEKLRPKVLNLKERLTVSEDKLAPTSAAVTLRENSKVLSAVRSSVEMLEPSASKEQERKSAPVPSSSTKTSSNKSTRRSSSAIDSANNEDTTTSVPEFMKIQLNRVDPVRAAKATVVLAKNVKEQQQPISPKDTEKSASIDDLSLRRYSNESVDITEKETPDAERRISGVFEAINKQAKSVSTSSIQQNNHNINNNNANDHLPPRSPVKKLPAASGLFSPISSEEVSVLRPKIIEQPSTALTLSKNKLSLQERKRLFLSEDRSKTEKKMEDLRNERKKSISEEVYRKSNTKSEEKLDCSSASPAEAVESPTVVLRKKSFGAASQTSSLNGNAVASITNSGRSNDPTPELMKVFARRSLKIKDEDLNAFQEKLSITHLPNNSSSTSASSSSSSTSTNSAKKFTPISTQLQQNVDSDKENQSASDEKLDKLPKFEVAIEQLSSISKVSNSGTSSVISSANTNSNNRNSVADFRVVKNGGGSLSNGLTVSNNNNNNNNNNMSITTTTTTAVSNVGKSFLPPLRVGGFRTIPIERNGSVNKLFGSSAAAGHHNSENNNNNALNNNVMSKPPPLERQSLNIKTSESASTFGQNKTIERSATVGEFKGIHQRRAEWEQRAKEALK